MIQIELEREGPYLPSQNEYIIYETLAQEKIDLLLCKNIPIEISYSLNQLNPKINITLVKTMV